MRLRWAPGRGGEGLAAGARASGLAAVVLLDVRHVGVEELLQGRAFVGVGLVFGDVECYVRKDGGLASRTVGGCLCLSGIDTELPLERTWLLTSKDTRGQDMARSGRVMLDLEVVVTIDVDGAGVRCGFGLDSLFGDSFSFLGEEGADR
ncbi:hypothetical protein DB35_15955 [Streptomyces abyssalis]|nr:hypothetical protein DB35_15955 [Streptomyces abyssalis]